MRGGHIGGVRLYVSFWFLAGLALFTLLDHSFLVPPFLCVIALHEGAHLAAMALFGAHIRAVELRLYGARIDADLSALSCRERAAVYLCAPVCNLILGSAALLIDASSAFGVFQLGVGLFQLAPIPPLDGGNAVREIFTSPGAARVLRWAAVLTLAAVGAAACVLCAVYQNFTLLVCAVYLAVMLAGEGKGK